MTEKQRQQTAARQQRFRERQAQVRKEEQVSKGLPALPKVPTIPGQSRWRAMIAQAHLLLSEAEAEMQAYYEDRSEEWQEGDAGVAFLERQDAVAAAVSQLGELT